jgi:hypothetical protein
LKFYKETSKPNNTCRKCVNDERPTGKKNTIIEWDDGEKGNSNLIVETFSIKQ